MSRLQYLYHNQIKHFEEIIGEEFKLPNELEMDFNFKNLFFHLMKSILDALEEKKSLEFNYENLNE